MKYSDEYVKAIGESVLKWAEQLAKEPRIGNHQVLPIKIYNGMISYVNVQKPAYQRDNAIEFYSKELHGEFISGFDE